MDVVFIGEIVVREEEGQDAQVRGVLLDVGTVVGVDGFDVELGVLGEGEDPDDLVRQMDLEDGGEGVEDLDEMQAREFFGVHTPDVVVKLFESGFEGVMLLQVGVRDTLDANLLFDEGEVGDFFAGVVVVDEFGPALAEGHEGAGVGGSDEGALQVDGVHAADNDVVGKSHLGGRLDVLVLVLLDVRLCFQESWSLVILTSPTVAGVEIRGNG